MAYSTKERKKLLARFSKLRTSGKTALQAAGSIGVSYMTLLRWERPGGKAVGRIQKGKRGRSESGVSAATRMSLVLPGGYRIEADSATDIIEVLKALK